MVVEITPIGIDSIGWRFYIIWTIFNFSFIPIVYLFYPETAGRTLEDIDQLFRESPSVIVCKDLDAVSSTRPFKYADRDANAMARNGVGSGGSMRKLKGRKSEEDGEVTHNEEV